MKPRTKERRVRNFYAVGAHFRKAGALKDRKKEANKKACRIWKLQGESCLPSALITLST